MRLRDVCLSPPPPVGDFRPATFSFSNADRTASFQISATPVNIGTGGTPLMVGGVEGEIQTTPRDDGGENVSLRVRKGGVTYVLISTVGVEGNRLTKEDLIGIAESIP